MTGKSAACKHLRSLAGGHVLSNTPILKWAKENNTKAGERVAAMIQGEIPTAELVTDVFTEYAVAKGSGPFIFDNYPPPGRFANAETLLAKLKEQGIVPSRQVVFNVEADAEVYAKRGNMDLETATKKQNTMKTGFDNVKSSFTKAGVTVHDVSGSGTEKALKDALAKIVSNNNASAAGGAAAAAKVISPAGSKVEIRDSDLVFVLGPKGSGKTTVANAIASACGKGLVMKSADLQSLYRTKEGALGDELREITQKAIVTRELKEKLFVDAAANHKDGGALVFDDYPPPLGPYKYIEQLVIALETAEADHKLINPDSQKVIVLLRCDAAALSERTYTPQPDVQKTLDKHEPSFDKVKESAAAAGFKIITVDAAPQECDVSDAVEFSFKSAYCNV